MRIMQDLQTNLDGKSKRYKDPALTNLCLISNIHYMVRSIRRSEAKDLLGDDWVQRHRRVVQQHAKQYKRISWGKNGVVTTMTNLKISGVGGSVEVLNNLSQSISHSRSPSKPDRSEIDLIKPVEMKRASVNQASLPAIYDQHDEKAYRNYYQVDGDKKLPTEDAFARSDEIA
ncbi:hypothetical protein T459_30984 [Capsicum annuum]|uniref:Exocyst subunit Exo70 family protein n=1 Tax=Capsicum annuum TaxID=4072 RepID=A0A2G2YA36_CAPAN|nr:hypothetical protein T459_30984 [Capsicum annuum]